MQRRTSGIIGMLLAAGVLASCLGSCSKDAAPGTGTALEFTAESPEMETKAPSYDSDHVFGRWDAEEGGYVPGAGIGVFAYHQKAKSNGYPTDFTRDLFSDPDYMYNQKLERSSSDGVTYHFTYSPKKYWPNNAGDRLSFIAYAPYDVTTAIEDLRLEMNLKATRFSRTYRIEKAIEEQTDYLWVDPVLNRMKPGADGSIDFELRHLCVRLGFSLGVNDGSSPEGTPTSWTDPNTVIRMESVKVKGAHREFTYTVNWDAADSLWVPSYSGITGSQDIELKGELMQNAEIGSATYTTGAFRQLNTADGWMMLAPQSGLSLELSYSVVTTDGDFRSVITNGASRTMGLELEAGKAYDIKLLLGSLGELSIASADLVEWDYSENTSGVTIM